MFRKLSAWGNLSLGLLLIRLTFFFRHNCLLTLSARVDFDNVSLLIVNSSDLDWLQLLLDISIQGALRDDLSRQLLVKLINIEVDMEQASVCRTDHVAEFLETKIGDASTALDR